MTASFGTGCSDSDEVERLLTKLISIASVNPSARGAFSWPPYGEAKLAGFVGDYVGGLGLDVRFQEVLPGRPNVVATMRGKAGQGLDPGRVLLLEAHLDTVQVDNMAIQPFTPRVEGNRIFGRGACDDKGSLAAMMLALKLMRENGCAPDATICFAAVADEEYKYRGVTHLLDSGVRVDAAIVGEPTDLDVVIAHKGCVRWTIVTAGKAAHSSRVEAGVNAIHKMADVIVALRSKLEPVYAARGHALVGPPTFSVGLISGGVGVNTVPDECCIHVDRRVLPGEKAEDVLREFREVLDEVKAQDPSLDVRMEPPYLIDIPMEVPEEEPIVQQVAAACRAVLGDARIRGVPYGTDASKVFARGIPSVVFGPGRIEQAHSACEYIEMPQVARAAEIIARVATEF